MPTYRWILNACLTCALAVPSLLRADQVEMQNGDRYVGTVVSLNTDSLTLHSQNLGKVLLPRAGVAVITLGPVATTAARPLTATNAAPDSAPAVTNSEIADAFKRLGSHTNFIPQIRDKFLADAGPEANNKFNEMLGGLMSGQLDMNGLRAQVKSAVDEIKTLKKEGGSEVGDSYDMYLGILEKFLKESGDTPAANASKAQTPPNR